MRDVLEMARAAASPSEAAALIAEMEEELAALDAGGEAEDCHLADSELMLVVEAGSVGAPLCARCGESVRSWDVGMVRDSWDRMQHGVCAAQHGTSS